MYDNVGFPRNVPDHTEWHREETDTLLEDINTKVEDLIKFHLNSRRARAIGFFQFPVPSLNESLDYLSLRLKMLKDSYDQTRASLENIIKSKFLKCIHNITIKIISIYYTNECIIIEHLL